MKPLEISEGKGGNPFHPNKIGLYPDRLERLRRGKLVAPITA